MQRQSETIKVNQFRDILHVNTNTVSGSMNQWQKDWSSFDHLKFRKGDLSHSVNSTDQSLVPLHGLYDTTSLKQHCYLTVIAVFF